MTTPVRELQSIGFAGWGKMGAAIGAHYLRRGWKVTVADPAPGAEERVTEAGAAFVSSVAEVAAASDLVFIAVIDDQQVRDTITGPGGALETARPGTVIVVCASVRPDTCAQLAEVASEKGVHVIDGALVRGGHGTQRGTVKLMCGGPEAVIRACHPVFSVFSTDICHVGDIGAGQVAKTANNILLWACIRADVEALRLAKALGVEPGRLRTFLLIGSGANRPLEDWGSPRLSWPKKDLEVALALAKDAGVEMPFVEQLAPLMEQLTVDDLQELR